jgi:anti-anti-sigma factor
MGRAASDGAGLRLDVRGTDTEAVLTFEGQLDISTAALVDTEIDHLGALLAVPLVIDLHRLEFIDCAGVRPLLRLWTEVEARHGQLSVSGATRLATLVLTTAGMAKTVTSARLRTPETEAGSEAS